MGFRTVQNCINKARIKNRYEENNEFNEEKCEIRKNDVEEIIESSNEVLKIK